MKIVNFLRARGLVSENGTDLFLTIKGTEKKVSLQELLTSWANIEIFETNNYEGKCYWFSFTYMEGAKLFTDDNFCHGKHPIEVVADLNIKKPEIVHRLQNWGELTPVDYVRFIAMYENFRGPSNITEENSTNTPDKEAGVEESGQEEFIPQPN